MKPVLQWYLFLVSHFQKITLYWHILIIHLMIETRFVIPCTVMKWFVQKTLTRRILSLLKTTNKMAIEHTSQTIEQKTIYSKDVRIIFATFL